jgi:nitrogen fixation NifU-like protein
MPELSEGKLELLREAGYSEKAIGYIQNDINVGKIENSDAVGDYTGECGDKIRIYLKIIEKRIMDAKFIYSGCAGAGSSGSAICELAKDKRLEEAIKLSLGDVLEHLKVGEKSLPESKHDCCEIAIGSLREAIKKHFKES